MNMRLTLTEQFTTLLVMLFTSKGAAGITGGGFVALAPTRATVNLVPMGSLSLRSPYGRDPGRHQPDQQCHRNAGCDAMEWRGGL